VFPPAIPETCIRAGSAIGGIVIDPFSGSGTTGLVALELGRRYVGIELNPEYVKMSEDRLSEHDSNKPDLLASCFEDDKTASGTL
jgi:site-specific DNA-methyltransferase (adenine-specific)